MTVNTTDITSGPYAGNGIATAYDYDFRIENKTQLKVFETDDNGVQTELTVDTDYTVSGIGEDGGGQVTRVAGALPLNHEWYIRADYKATQATSFESQGGFFPDVHEAAFDKLTFLHQQQQDQIDKSFRLPDGYGGEASTALPEPVALNFVRWNAAGTALENTLGTTSAVAADVVFTPSGGIAATDVQAAIEELDTEKLGATAKAADSELLDGKGSSEFVDQDSDTGAANMPTGTTAQRPGTPAEGMFRRNSETGQFEGYDGSSWVVVGSAGTDTGAVIAWPTGTVPDGYLECDGSSVSRSTYSALFAVIGTDYGNVDGNTFNLPDYRGEFLRGWANTSSNDPDKASRTDRGDGTTGDAVGTKQADEFKSHTHSVQNQTGSTFGQPSGQINDGAGNTGATGGNETRPRNINVMYCIKY